MLRIVFVLLLAAGATGCSSDHADLHTYFQEVEARGETRHGIAPLPDMPAPAAHASPLSRNPFSDGD